MIGSISEAMAQLADIEKRRKRKAERREPVTDAHAMSLGEDDAREAGEAGKAYADRGAHEGPEQPVQAGHPEPDQYQRPYIEPGHGAESPQADPPRKMPITHAAPGQVQHVTLTADAMAQPVPAHVTAHYSSGSPSERGAR